MNTRTHACKHTHARAHEHAYTHACAHVRFNANTCTHALTHTHTCALLYGLALTWHSLTLLSCFCRCLAETVLYSLLRARCSCYVSVGHRMQLLHYHTHVLEFKEGGSSGKPDWAMCTAQEFQQRLHKGSGVGGLSVV